MAWCVNSMTATRGTCMPDTARYVLDQLDSAILLLTPALDQVRFHNAGASALLRALGAAGDAPPPALITVVETGLASTPGSGFSPAVPLPTPDGARYAVRARQLPSASGVVALATRIVSCERELADLLYARHGLSRRDSRIVAYVRAGLSNVEIAREMGLQCGTVRQYMSAIFSVHRRTQLISAIESMSA
jgi:DNA-binding CsgD family transcriptional regulator